MELYKSTGKTKTGEIASARPLGALLITVDKAPNEITSERITIFIERAEGSNTSIATKIPLLDFALGASFGNGAIRVAGDETSKTTYLYCELTEGGAVQLHENERIKVLIESLNSTKTYQINGIEMPYFSDDIVTYDIKQVLAGEQSRKFNVLGYEHAILSNSTEISEVHFTFVNGTTTKYNQDELKAIAFDVDPVQIVNSGLVENFVSDRLVLPLIDVESIDIYKNDNTGVVDVVLRNENDDLFDED